MTLSNFDWTDKSSVKWFILLPNGHQGPYSLEELMSMQGGLERNVQVWAEGLADPVRLSEAFQNSNLEMPLPPLPDDEVPPFFAEESSEEEIPAPPQKKKSFNLVLTVSLIFLTLFFILLAKYLKGREVVEIKRQSKMTMELHSRMEKENPFGGWDKKLFFKEYLPQDHSSIWFATSSFATCEVEAVFNSVRGKLLTLTDDKVSFKTKGHLSHHIVEFSQLDFQSGQRIVPGLYEVDIKATNCHWEGFLPRMMNFFTDADEDYMARTKVVLFSRGAEEFNRNLETLLKKKMEKELKEKSQNDIFWQDMQQKMETLEAITLQIEQLFLDYVDTRPDTFIKNLKQMIDEYTRKYGSFLTSFVVENENYFKSMKGDSEKRNYELMVRLMSKKIGLESMRFIEEFQKMKKNPSEKDLEKIKTRVKTVFGAVKKDITKKISQVASDRSK